MHESPYARQLVEDSLLGFTPPTLFQAEVVLNLRDQEGAMAEDELFDKLRASGSQMGTIEFGDALERLTRLGVIRPAVGGLILQIHPPTQPAS